MRKITIIIMSICLFVLVLWDIYAYIYGENSTISVVLTDWSREFPAIAFLFGVLMGHWFFPAKGSED